MNTNKQLKEWVKGNSLCPNEDGECCPDFSCCKPELLADEKTRKAFINADKSIRTSILGMFLGAAFNLAAENKKVYIAGLDDYDTEH